MLQNWNWFTIQDKTTFTDRSLVNLFIVWSIDLNIKSTLVDYLCRVVKLTENADSDKYGYSGCGSGFDACWQFSLNSGWGKTVIFGVGKSFLVHTDGKKDFLVLGKIPTDGLDDTQ